MRPFSRLALAHAVFFVFLRAYGESSLPEVNANNEPSTPASSEKTAATERVARASLQFEKVAGPDGATYIVQSVSYADGSKLRALAGLWLDTGSVPIEVSLLSERVLPPKTLGPVATAEEGAQPQPSPHRDDFPAGSQVDLRMTKVFVDATSFDARPLNSELGGQCREGELAAVARLASNLKRTPLQLGPEQSKESTEPYFKLANLVCLKIIKGS